MIIGLLRTIIVVAIIYFIIKWVVKMFEPNKQQANNRQQQYKQNVGETTIKFDKKGEKIINKNEGEYVDFEEVK